MGNCCIEGPLRSHQGQSLVHPWVKDNDTTTVPVHVYIGLHADIDTVWWAAMLFIYLNFIKFLGVQIVKHVVVVCVEACRALERLEPICETFSQGSWSSGPTACLIQQLCSTYRTWMIFWNESFDNIPYTNTMCWMRHTRSKLSILGETATRIKTRKKNGLQKSSELPGTIRDFFISILFAHALCGQLFSVTPNEKAMGPSTLGTHETCLTKIIVSVRINCWVFNHKGAHPMNQPLV